MRTSKLVVLGAAMIVAASLASAFNASADPYPQTRNGFYLGLGIGGGTGAASLSGNGFSASSDRQGGAVGSLRLGWSVMPQLSLGVESNSWARTESGQTVSMSVYTAGATYYPNPSQGFFMRAGVGGGNESFSVSSGNSSGSASQSGFGFTVGTGYEMRLMPHWSLGPAVDYGYVNVKNQGFNISSNYVNFTAAMNWYFF
ncbi:MAG TPA: outer membrane beta-barrel protein [Candidatus Sulfotelmatobacter sp.]|nr:outer membrane beta-barrel protein [Candidatus Sulfotelmatobacter sp.]